MDTDRRLFEAAQQVVVLLLKRVVAAPDRSYVAVFRAVIRRFVVVVVGGGQFRRFEARQPVPPLALDEPIQSDRVAHLHSRHSRSLHAKHRTIINPHEQLRIWDFLSAELSSLTRLSATLTFLLSLSASLPS